MTKLQILNEIKRTAEANGGAPLGSAKFATETGILSTDWKGKIWARWSDALREAGYTPNELNQAYDKLELLQKYAKLALDLGRLPAKRRGGEWFELNSADISAFERRKFM